MTLAIRPAAPSDIPEVRTLFTEYQRSLGVDLCFQGFDEELAALPGAYAPPRGALFVARPQSGAAIEGCIGLRPLEAGIAEMKRLYVRPALRGTGAGRALAQAVIDAARAAGYSALRLDTLADMHAARALYARLGFRDIAPYYANPLPDTRYMELAL